jgi:hypothetical protein
MVHVRTQIRTLAKQALEAELDPLVYTVFSSRTYRRNTSSGKALVDIQFTNDQQQEPATQGSDRDHVASLYVRVQRYGHENEIDDQLDQDELNVVAALNTVDWSNILEMTERLEPLQVNFADDESGAEIIAALIIRFDLDYRIDLDNPETPLE